MTANLLTDKRLLTAAVISVLAVAAVAMTSIITITSMPGYVLLGLVGTLALYLAMRFGNLSFAGASARRGGSGMAFGALLLVAVLVGAYALIVPAAAGSTDPVEAQKPPEVRLQQVTVKGTLNVETDPGFDEGSFVGTNVDWRDQPWVALNFFAFPGCSLGETPTTVDVRLVDVNDVQEDYTGSAQLSGVCQGWFAKDVQKEFEIKVNKVVPGEYTVYVSATQTEDTNSKVIAQKTLGKYKIQHRPGA